MAIVSGTNGNDSITPFGASPGLTGWVVGLPGDDSLLGGGGNDTLDGGPGNDTLQGGSGLDFFEASPGADVIDGGEQGTRNTVSYRDGAVPGGVSIVMANSLSGTVTKGDGSIDTLQNITDIWGSSEADTFVGTAVSVGVIGFRFRPGPGNDTINGAANTVVAIDYFDAPTAINIDLAAGIASADGFGGTDTLIGVRFVRASASSDDTILGSDANEQFAVGGSGNKTIDGGGGIDTYRYALATAITATLGATLVGGVPAGTVVKASGTDTIIGIENLVGGGGNDSILGSSADNVMGGEVGADTVDGGAGFDTYDLNASTQAVVPGGAIANLSASSRAFAFGTVAAGTARDPWGSTDVLFNFEAVRGTEFNDTLIGGAGSESLSGAGGNDQIEGGNGNDTLVGGAGDDGLNGGEGNDLIQGGAGADFVTGSAGSDTVDGGEFNARNTLAYTGFTGGPITAVFTTNDNATVTKAGGGVDTLLFINAVRGTAGNDTLNGAIITADYGNTLYLRGSGGNDVITGNGTARVTAEYTDAPKAVNVDLGLGIATQDGYDGVDTLINVARVHASMNHNDTLTGGTRDEAFLLLGPGGSKLINGGGGIDIYRTVGASAGVVIDLALGTAVKTGGGTDTLVNIEDAGGGTGADSLYGDAGNNGLTGDAGSDLLDGRGGFDTANYVLNFFLPITKGVIVNLATGLATDPWDNIDTLLSIEGVIGTNVADTVLGDGLANSLAGRAGDDSLASAGGNDTILGEAGNDTLDGGTGLDSLVGGTGNDLIIVDNAGDTVAELADEGTDTVQASISWTLGENLEALVLTGTARNGTGNALDNLLTGTGARNVLNGGEGEDTLEGGAGGDQLDGGAGADSLVGGANNDTYLVDDAGDVILELAGGGADTVRASVDWTLGDQLEDLVLLSGAVAGTGNTLNNVIEGNGAANTLSGLGGRDLLLGNAGNDTLLGGDGLDTLEGGGGRDSMEGGTNNDLFRWALASHGRDTISGFNPAQDDLAFSAAGFGGGLVAGVALTAAQFESNTTGTATTADARFVYSTTSGVLSFDIDGNGAAAAANIATFIGNPALTAADFVITP